MPSRLSSLLVRDGLVGVKRMEKAFQRQVIYGGSLDTTLLEMGLVPEERLAQYLALASGLPPATRTESNVFDAEAVRLCPQEWAIRYRVVPLCLEGGSLRVLVHDPVDMGLLEELADQVDVPVQPLIVPEYRWHVVFTRNYGGQPTARFSTLARAADSSPTTSPVGRARTVIVDADEQAHQVVDVRAPLRPIGPEVITMKFAVVGEDGQPVAAGAPVVEPAAPPVAPEPQISRTLTPIERPVHHAPTGPTPATPAGLHGRDASKRHTRPVAVPPPPEHPPAHTHPPAPPRAPVEPPRRTTSSVEITAEEAGEGEVGTPPITPPKHTAQMSAQAVKAHYDVTESQRIEAVARRRESQPPSGPTSDGVPTRPLASGNTPHSAPASGATPPPDDGDSPLAVPAARALIAAAADRDHVFYALLRALRGRARWAGLLTVQGGAAIGRVAIAEAGLDTASMPSVLIPLDVPSAFQTTAAARHPYVGAIATGKADIDPMIARMGGVMPPSALLLPIVLRDRCVALAVAHRGADPISLAETTELLPMAAAAADGLQRLIVRSKSAGFRVPTPAPGVPATEIDAEQVATKKQSRAAKKDSAWAVPAPEPAAAAPPLVMQPAIGVAGSITLPAARPIAAVLDDVEGDDEARSEAAIAEALERVNEIGPALPARFPGRLRVDRYQVSGRALRPGQYGGLLELVVRLGSLAGDLLLEKMADTRRDVRFYATVCCAAIRPRSAVYALVERLFDPDYGVRGCAIEALSGYPLRDLDMAMIRARHALHSEDLERVSAAASAIAELADVQAIADLIDIVGRDSKRAEMARRALVALTRQDHGASERKWRKWWDENRAHHRVEWLIAALDHKESAVRTAAFDDLRRLTGESLGFVPDGGRRERDAARERWAQWWNETGRRRFLKDEDERHRPTAVLPSTSQRRD